eukprot:scaffold52391_cov15-Prasinocladus_malaysianus.AAC.1
MACRENWKQWAALPVAPQSLQHQTSSARCDCHHAPICVIGCAVRYGTNTNQRRDAVEAWYEYEYSYEWKCRLPTCRSRSGQSHSFAELQDACHNSRSATILRCII